VTARSDSAFYVLRKLAARHYFHTSVIAALIAAMIGFGGISYHTLQREREARRDREKAVSGYISANLHMKEFMESFAREQAVGWLLLDWREGREDAARETLAKLREGSPEHTAMRYLIKGDIDEDELKRQLLPAAMPLYHFVLGEHHRVRGDHAQARLQFKACVAAPGDKYAWFRKAAIARLNDLGTSATSPARSSRQRLSV